MHSKYLCKLNSTYILSDSLSDGCSLVLGYPRRSAMSTDFRVICSVGWIFCNDSSEECVVIGAVLYTNIRIQGKITIENTSKCRNKICKFKSNIHCIWVTG